MFMTSCATTEPAVPPSTVPTTPPPAIRADMPLAEALRAGIDYGGDTLDAVKRLVKRRSEELKAAQGLAAELEKKFDTMEPHQLLNSGNLYASFTPSLGLPIFTALLGGERPMARQLGWQLAALKPSASMAAAIDKVLSRAVMDDDENSVLLPQMANAVAANHLASAYTLVRRGLMTKGDEEFAQAMLLLNPHAAASDFLDYLAQAPAEELRQLTLSTVDLYTCLAILKHMQQVPPNPGHARFEHLFLYAVSRNTGLSEMANKVLEHYVPEQTELMAQLLARQPAWAQLAYIETVRRSSSAKSGLLLAELKKTTTEVDVAAEIDQIRF